METLALILMLLGFVASTIGSLWFLIVVFKHNILVGILCLFTGIASLVALIIYWPDTKKPFLWQVVGLVLVVGGALLGGDM